MPIPSSLPGPAVIDAHHHLWDLQACRYPWLMARGVRRFFGDPTPIQRDYLVGDLLRDAAGVPLAGSVHVQVGVAPGDELAETRWLQGVAEGTGNPAGLPNAIVAGCDLADAALPARLQEQRHHPNLRGVRQIVGRAPHDEHQARSDALLDDPAWQAGLAQLAAQGLSFDLQMIPSQASRVARVLARVPQLRVALCHCGSPWDRSPSGLAAWAAGLRTLASLPNLWCKLSGFGMFDPQWTVDSMRPVVETVIGIFGARRCMFGSNFPVEKLVLDYGTLWARYAAWTDGLDADARRRLFAGSAAEFYRIGASGAASNDGAASNSGAAGESPPRTT
jgi:predicted TIM-barrel fold metal-dependent hydrolase